jgi:transposase
MDETLNGPALDESAHTTDRKSARNARVEVITRGERRRSWTLEQKREIVAESLGSELTPSEVARKYAIGTGQLYTWRRELLPAPTERIRRPARFAQVELAPTRPAGQLPAEQAAPPVTIPQSPRPVGMIEIVLPGGILVRVDGQVDDRALRRVLGMLQGR